MLQFRRTRSLWKFAWVHSDVLNQLDLERHFVNRQTYKERRSAALSKWQVLAS